MQNCLQFSCYELWLWYLYGRGGSRRLRKDFSLTQVFFFQALVFTGKDIKFNGRLET